MVKNLPTMRETWVWSLGWEDPLEKSMATHSSILAWRIPMDRRAWRDTVHGVTKNQSQEAPEMFSRNPTHWPFYRHQHLLVNLRSKPGFWSGDGGSVHTSCPELFFLLFPAALRLLLGVVLGRPCWVPTTASIRCPSPAAYPCLNGQSVCSLWLLLP